MVDQATDDDGRRLNMARFRRKPVTCVIHPSDGGSQYARHAFQAQPKGYGIMCSMSRKENCCDKLPTECFFDSLKHEWVHGIRHTMHAADRANLFDYIELFCNRRRQHIAFGYATAEKFMAT